MSSFGSASDNLAGISRGDLRRLGTMIGNRNRFHSGVGLAMAANQGRQVTEEAPGTIARHREENRKAAMDRLLQEQAGREREHQAQQAERLRQEARQERITAESRDASWARADAIRADERSYEERKAAELRSRKEADEARKKREFDASPEGKYAARKRAELTEAMNWEDAQRSAAQIPEADLASYGDDQLSTDELEEQAVAQRVEGISRRDSVAAQKKAEKDAADKRTSTLDDERRAERERANADRDELRKERRHGDARRRAYASIADDPIAMTQFMNDPDALEREIERRTQIELKATEKYMGGTGDPSKGGAGGAAPADATVPPGGAGGAGGSGAPPAATQPAPNPASRAAAAAAAAVPPPPIPEPPPVAGPQPNQGGGFLNSIARAAGSLVAPGRISAEEQAQKEMSAAERVRLRNTPAGRAAMNAALKEKLDTLKTPEELAEFKKGLDMGSVPRSSIAGIYDELERRLGVKPDPVVDMYRRDSATGRLAREIGAPIHESQPYPPSHSPREPGLAETISRLPSDFSKGVDLLAKDFDEATTAAGVGLNNAYQGAKEAVGGFVKGIGDAAGDILGNARDDAKGFTVTDSVIRPGMGRLNEAAGILVRGAEGAIDSGLNSEAVTGLRKAAGDVAGEVSNSITDKARSIYDTAGQAAGKIAEEAMRQVEGARSGLGKLGKAAGDVVGDVGNDVQDFYGGGAQGGRQAAQAEARLSELGTGLNQTASDALFGKKGIVTDQMIDEARAMRGDVNPTTVQTDDFSTQETPDQGIESASGQDEHSIRSAISSVSAALSGRVPLSSVAAQIEEMRRNPEPYRALGFDIEELLAFLGNQGRAQPQGRPGAM